MFQSAFVERGDGICFVGSGTVTGEEIERARLALSNEEDRLRQIRFAILDLEETTGLSVPAGYLRSLVEFDLPGPLVAVVAPRQQLACLAAMCEEFSGTQTEVFRSSAEACRWVSLHYALQR